MQSFVAGIGMAILVAAAAVPAQAAPAKASPKVSADARFEAIYTKEWAWRTAQFGRQDGKGVDDYLPKMDQATQDMRQHYWEDTLKQVEAIPHAQLSQKQQVNYDVYVPQLKVLIEDQKFHTYEMPANSDSQFWSGFGDDDSGFKTVQDYKNWIAQMRDIPRYFDEEVALMKAGLARGFTPPQVTLVGRDKSISNVIAAKPEDTSFYKPFKTMAGVPADQQAALRAQAASVIRDTVQPAYVGLLKFWNEQYVPGARKTLAADDLPNGKAFYRSQIIEYTTLDMDPAEIHRIGEQEVATLHQQMLDAMKETGFKGDFDAFQKFLRSDPQFYAKTPQELLDKAAWIAKTFDGKAATYFGMMPRARFAIVPVPADIAPFYTSGRGGPGVYLLNTYDLPHRPLFNLTALTLHESAPGHAWQIPLAAEDKTQPDFRRYTYISAYGEGWALYCEWLGNEMGMYETPYDRYGMLGYQIWRAARLVVDTGIHSQGWTRQQAIDYMVKYTSLPEHEVETEVDRYITWPGQALSYYMGEMEIKKLRAKAEAALGPKFNIRAFHDTVLQLGSVPLPVLDARIDKFIADGGKGPYPDLE
ncbi:MAG TPA: DUF885 family protein [Rhizomicrobium sp.]|jgi:uncharacterized protein (DUF885 family)